MQMPLPWEWMEGGRDEYEVEVRERNAVMTVCQKLLHGILSRNE